MMRLVQYCTASILLVSLFQQANAASFNCQKSKNSTEKAICQHLSLNDADVRLATTYQLLISHSLMGTRGDLRDSQAAWLKQRNQCGAKTTCISQWYQQRQAELDGIADSLFRP